MKAENKETETLSSSHPEPESGKFSERLREAIGSQSVLAFSKECGISDSLVRKYLTGSLPGTDNLVAMARSAGVNIAWLAAGEGHMRKEFSSAPAAPQADDDKYAYVPLYDARCSAGHGCWTEGARVLTMLAFTSYSLRKKGLEVAKLSAVRVDGDSMEGLLSDGDTVMIDHSRNALEGEAVYVIRLDDHLYAKRLQRQFDGSIQIISENKAYQNMVVPKEHLADLEIIGRVVWAGGWMV